MKRKNWTNTDIQDLSDTHTMGRPLLDSALCTTDSLETLAGRVITGLPTTPWVGVDYTKQTVSVSIGHS
jgi:hypothetical protein